MKTLRTILLLAAVLLCLGACGRGKTAAEGTVRATDTIRYARNLHIAYYDDYVSVRIRDPWDTLRQRQHYVLVDRDKPLPARLPADGTVIRVPVEKAVIYTSVHTAIAEELGALDQVAGICEPQYITSPEVLRRIGEGRIADLGMSTSPNVEKIIDIGTEMIIASPFENSGYGSAEKLGIPIVEAADYMENHPLGRTEWVLFYGLLLGCREEAGDVFARTERRYLELKELAAGVAYRPTVLLERRYGNSWAVPSGGSYIGVMHADAGADYVFRSYSGAKSVHLTFESVYDQAGDADFWFLKYDTKAPMTYTLLKQEYEPYANFRPWKERRVFACNTITSTYYDDITLHPDQVLEDLIAIYHPERLPDHKQRYYFPLDE